MRFWINGVKEHTPEDCKILIIGNKADLKQKRVIEFKELQILAEENKCLYCEASALDSQNPSIKNNITKLIEGIFD